MKTDLIFITNEKGRRLLDRFKVANQRHEVL